MPTSRPSACAKTTSCVRRTSSWSRAGRTLARGSCGRTARSGWARSRRARRRSWSLPDAGTAPRSRGLVRRSTGARWPTRSTAALSRSTRDLTTCAARPAGRSFRLASSWRKDSKNQPFFVTLGAPPPPVEKVPPRATGGGIPAAKWVLGGVAVVGALSFTAFAVAGREVQSCAPDCTRGQVDDLRRDYAIADVSWITGLVAAGAALIFALAAPASPHAPPTTALRW